MTIQEATRVVYLIHAAYPQDRNAKEAELLDRIDLWAVFFADKPAALVDRAVKAWIKSSSFMPTPEEINKACETLAKLERTIKDAGYIHQIPEPSPEVQEQLDRLIEFLLEEGAFVP